MGFYVLRFLDGGRCDCSLMGIGEVYETSRFDKFRELHRVSRGGHLGILAINPIYPFGKLCLGLGPKLEIVQEAQSKTA